jgi:hypothetical protein
MVIRRTHPTVLAAALSAAWLGVVAVVALHHTPWGDEQHYILTVQSFGRNMGAETLRTYDELPPPLAFALYAWWRRLAGFTLPRLRVLSLIIAFATAIALHGLARRVLRDERDALLAASSGRRVAGRADLSCADRRGLPRPHALLVHALGEVLHGCSCRWPRCSCSRSAGTDSIRGARRV